MTTEALSAEIRASRWRIVAAQDSERRELERDLHDGAQPSLTAVRLSPGPGQPHGPGRERGRRAAGTGPVARDRSPTHWPSWPIRLRGLDPQIISLPELAAALRDQAALLGAHPLFRVTSGQGGTGQTDGTAAGGTDGTAAGRSAGTAAGEGAALDPVIGAAVYFCCTEALQNTVKHCPEAPVEVCLDLDADAGRLRFTVADQGPGFEMAAIPAGGGLQNMADRIGAVGGDLTVRTEPGHGHAGDRLGALRAARHGAGLGARGDVARGRIGEPHWAGGATNGGMHAPPRWWHACTLGVGMPAPSCRHGPAGDCR